MSQILEKSLPTFEHSMLYVMFGSHYKRILIGSTPCFLTSYWQIGTEKGCLCEGGNENGGQSKRCRDEQSVSFDRKRPRYRCLSWDFFSFCASCKGFRNAWGYGYSNG